jgi:F-type H+-transporting ATPase subunit delta
LEVKIDNSILGGLVLKIGDQVIDGSLKTKLESLEKSLLAV